MKKVLWEPQAQPEAVTRKGARVYGLSMGESAVYISKWTMYANKRGAYMLLNGIILARTLVFAGGIKRGTFALSRLVECTVPPEFVG